MHMADALLSPAVGLSMWAASAGAMTFSAAKIRREELSDHKLPIMAVAGAFVFAAQMINFTLPGTGSSGHLGGGMLLAALLGGYPALLTISAVLVIQSLFFADGGLLALGCNILNMGVIPCLLVYPLIFKPLSRSGLTAKKTSLAVILSAVVSLQLGSLAVVLQTTASGITQLPFSAFLALMQPIHLAIGIVEGIVTAAILAFVRQMRPEILQGTPAPKSFTGRVSVKKTLIILLIVALFLAGGLSVFASAYPDGLEWSIAKVAGTADLPAKGGLTVFLADIQQALALMPDYDYAAGGENRSVPSVSVAGLIGTGLTFALAGLTGLAITVAKKRKKAAAEPKSPPHV